MSKPANDPRRLSAQPSQETAGRADAAGAARLHPSTSRVLRSGCRRHTENVYQVYGLIIRTSRALPGLMPMARPNRIDLQIDLDGQHTERFQSLPQQLWYASQTDRYGNFVRVWKLAAGAYFRFRYSDGAEFVIDRCGSRIWVTRPPALSIDDIFAYLVGHILGFTLGLRGRLCLHASAVAIDGRAVALMAPGGGGKSTTAAVFADLGYPILTDDVLVLLPRNGAWMVQPGYPRINLWPASIPALCGTTEDLPRIVPESATYCKRYLDLHQGRNRFQSMPLRLAAIYTGKANGHCGKPFVTAVPAADAMMALAAQLYRFPLIGRAGLEKEFELLARVASLIPLRSVTFHRELHRIRQLCRAIREDFRTVPTHPDAKAAAVDETVF